MSFEIFDARRNPKGRSLPNVQREADRQQDAIQEAVRRRLAEGGLKDLAQKGGKQIRVRPRGFDEPNIVHDPESGISDRVYPGNKKFTTGDRVPRPEKGGGSGSQGSDTGEGEDEFYFEMSYAEWLDAIFDGLEIPNMVKRFLAGEEEFEIRRAGFATDGPPNKMDPLKTLSRSLPRRAAFRLPHLRRKGEIEDELRHIEEALAAGMISGDDAEEKRKALKDELDVVNRKLKKIPFIERQDLRFKRHELYPVPVSQAVMFCLMDVSGSMEEWHKEMAKRFFLLLYLFLTRNYERVEVVFIRHTQYAAEVSEEEFFTGRETGGTIVSSALELMKTIIDERYPLNEWNLYGCHASDGDDWQDDLPLVETLLTEELLPILQYYAYVDVNRSSKRSELWQVLAPLENFYENFAIAEITDQRDIYPVFRKLFEVQSS